MSENWGGEITVPLLVGLMKSPIGSGMGSPVALSTNPSKGNSMEILHLHLTVVSYQTPITLRKPMAIDTLYHNLRITFNDYILPVFFTNPVQRNLDSHSFCSSSVPQHVNHLHCYHDWPSIAPTKYKP